MKHHANLVKLSTGALRVAQPSRDRWWAQRKRERRCRREIGHCWHLEGILDWWCCECGAEIDGMPLQRCVLCAIVSRP